MQTRHIFPTFVLGAFPRNLKFAELKGWAGQLAALTILTTRHHPVR